jgi:hypothetical protein
MQFIGRGGEAAFAVNGIKYQQGIEGETQDRGRPESGNCGRLFRNFRDDSNFTAYCCASQYYECRVA